MEKHATTVCNETVPLDESRIKETKLQKVFPRFVNKEYYIHKFEYIHISLEKAYKRIEAAYPRNNLTTE